MGAVAIRAHSPKVDTMSQLHQASAQDVTPQISELWYTRCPVPTISGIAQHFRWLHDEFDEIGIALQSIRASADRSVRASHYNHTHPGMFREGGNIPAIWSRGEGQNTAVVGITWVDEEQVILVRPESPIQTVADLKGRRLGLPKHATKLVDFARAMDLRGFVTALELAGLKPADATFIDVAADDYDLREQRDNDLRQSATVSALLNAEVDAIYAKGAVSATLIAEYGFRVLLDINANPDPFVRINNGTPRPITVDRDLAIDRPDIVARYLAVLLRGAKWAVSHPDEVVRAVAAETDASENSVRRGYGPELHLRLETKLTSEFVSALENQKNFLRDWGFVKDFDYADWIVSTPLQLAEELVANEATRSLNA
jgi:sulfonate transport system substrate-binding protein